MAVFVDKSVVSSVLIGRADYLTSFERVFAQLGSDHLPTILITGEAGIGKSRLVAEAKARLGPQQVCCLQGFCFPHDRALFLAPLVDMLRGLLLGSARNDYVSHCAPFASELIKILPDLAFWLPGVKPTPTLEPEQEKRRLFAALTGFLLGLTTQRPVVLLLEDLHWSDESSLEFLRFLLRHRGAQPLLLLLTYRDNEVQLALQRFLTELNREHVAREFALTALSEEEVHALVRAIFPTKRPVHRPFLHTLYALTEGDPFFVEEVLKVLLARGDIFFLDGVWDRKPLETLHIPSSISATVQQRLAEVSEGVREMLAVAAVVGRRIEFSLLQALVPFALDELLSLIETALAAQLLVKTADGQVAFRHALTQQAVYEQILKPRRIALHLHVGQAMEQLYASTLESHLAELAYHWYQAQAWQQAFVYGRTMGERALALDAPYAANEHFTHALEAATHLPEADPIPLYLARGQAQKHLGDFEGARSDIEQALQLARTAHNSEAEWQSLLRLGWLWNIYDNPPFPMDDFIQQLIALAQTLGDPQKYALSQNLLGHWLAYKGQVEASMRIHEEALAVFQRQNVKSEVALTLKFLGQATELAGDLRRALDYFDQAIALAQAVDEKQLAATCLTYRSQLLSPAFNEPIFGLGGTLADCRQHLEEVLSLAHAIEWRDGHAFAHITAGYVFTSYGLLGEGLTHARAALEMATESKNPQWMAGAYASLGEVYLTLLDPLEAIAALHAGLEVARTLDAPYYLETITVSLARAFLLTGEMAQAEATLARAISPDQVPRHLQGRRILSVWGTLALAQQQPEQALHVAERLISSVPGEDQGRPIPALWALRGEALDALGRAEESLCLLEEAATEAQEQGALPLLWQIQRALGYAGLHAKQRVLARRAFAAARETLATLSTSLDDEQQRTAFVQAALATLPKEHTPTARQASKQAFAGLSEREREIAGLVAQGKTNREIAEALTISLNTTTTHLVHIYNRLGMSSRAQLAAWAVEKGLAHHSSSEE